MSVDAEAERWQAASSRPGSQASKSAPGHDQINEGSEGHDSQHPAASSSFVADGQDLGFVSQSAETPEPSKSVDEDLDGEAEKSASPSPTPARFIPSPPPFAAPSSSAPRPRKPYHATPAEEAPSTSASSSAEVPDTENNGLQEQKKALMRKVAQLTKVVVHLNARNDESEARYDRLRSGLEEEICTMTQDAALKVAGFRKQVAELEDREQLEADASKQEAEYSDAKSRMHRDLQAFRSEVQGRQERLVDMGQAQLRRHSLELRNLEKELKASLQAFREALGVSRAELERRDTELRGQRSAELHAVAQEHQRRRDDLQAAHAREIASLNGARSQALCHINRLHESELTTLKMQALQKRRDTVHRLEQDFHEERRSLEQIISHISYELEQTRCDALDASRSRETMQQQIASMRVTLKEMTRRAEAGEAEASKAREEAALKEAELAELQGELTVLQVRQRAAGVSDAPAPPSSVLPAGGAPSSHKPPEGGAALSEELREAIASAKSLESELNQADVALAYLEDDLTEKEKQVEILEVEIEEEQLRNHQLQARILEHESGVKS